jgi:hypothetical protein
VQAVGVASSCFLAGVPPAQIQMSQEFIYTDWSKAKTEEDRLKVGAGGSIWYCMLPVPSCLDAVISADGMLPALSACQVCIV